MELVLFLVFAATSVVTGVGVVVLRDPVRAALSLIGCFFSIACLYLLQAAELIAVLEVLVYAGAIMVIFVFVIMLVEHHDDPVIPPALLRRMLVPVKVGAVGLVMINLIVVITRRAFVSVERLPAGFGSARSIGHELFTAFTFQFELASVLLLVAVVGAVMISRREDR